VAHHHEQKVPRPILVGAAILIALSIGIAAVGRSNRVAAEEAREVDGVELRFADREDGAVVVLDADTGREVLVVEPEGDGFLRGVLRGMFRTRMLESVDRDAPFVLGRQPDGRFVLSDPETGHQVELRSFGRTNYETFAHLLDASRSVR